MSSGKQIKFIPIGGGETIGGSAYWLQVGEVKVLVDFGIHPQQEPNITYQKALDLMRSKGLVNKLNDISAVIITHAHTDHSGLAPALYKEMYQEAQGKRIPPFYASQATKSLLPYIYGNVLIFSDQVPFTRRDADEMVYQHLRPEETDGALDWAHPQLGRIRFYPNSHLLGAVMVELEIEDRLILFTGDMQVYGTPTLLVGTFPTRSPDLLVIDGTHAGASSQSNQFSWSQGQNELNEILDQVLERNGVILLPSFALGRAQDILALVLEYTRLRQDDNFYIYVDGQAKEVTKNIYPGFRNLLSSTYMELYEKSAWRIRFLNIDTELSELVRTEISGYPTIVIASSGMLLQGSASRRWAEALADQSNNQIVFTGYLMEDVREEVFVQGIVGGTVIGEYPKQLSISGHASFSDTLAFIQNLAPKAVIIVHCGGVSSEDLQRSGSLCGILNEQGFPCKIASDKLEYIY